jgi:hypothetical protein
MGIQVEGVPKPEQGSIRNLDVCIEEEQVKEVGRFRAPIASRRGTHIPWQPEEANRQTPAEGFHHSGGVVFRSIVDDENLRVA